MNCLFMKSMPFPEVLPKAMSYVGITCQGKMYWGVGIDDDIIKSSINALVVAVNQLPDIQAKDSVQDERLIAMQNYMQANYQTVTFRGIFSIY